MGKISIEKQISGILEEFDEEFNVDGKYSGYRIDVVIMKMRDFIRKKLW